MMLGGTMKSATMLLLVALLVCGATLLPVATHAQQLDDVPSGDAALVDGHDPAGTTVVTTSDEVEPATVGGGHPSSEVPVTPDDPQEVQAAAAASGPETGPTAEVPLEQPAAASAAVAAAAPGGDASSVLPAGGQQSDDNGASSGQEDELMVGAAAAVAPAANLTLIKWPPVALWPPIIIWPGFLKTPRRYSIKYINDLPTTDRYRILFILAVQKMQSTPGLYGFGPIADIHGSAIPYNNASNPACGPTPTACTAWGYCPHNSPLFATWHRPYLSLYEEALVSAATAVANSFVNAAEKSAYLALAPRMRVPFLNPAAGYTNLANFTILDAMVLPVDDPATNATVLVNITNPLRSYAASWRSPTWKNTLATNAASYGSQFSTFQISGASWGCTWYDVPAAPCPVGSSNRLENTHGNIHVHIGGTMSNPATAGRDPIFMMHHANIDRILQAWQGTNPTIWMPPGIETYGTYYQPVGSAVSGTTPLAPFVVSPFTPAGSYVSVNSTRYFHNNWLMPFSARYSYVHLNVTGARRRHSSMRKMLQDTEMNSELSNRIVAAQVLAENTELMGMDRIRLQYKIELLNYDQLGRPFCIHYLLGGNSIIQRYTVATNVINLEGLQSDKNYCGSYCTLRRVRDTNMKALVGEALTDITRCTTGLNIPVGPAPWQGPSNATNPLKLSNFTLLTTQVPLTDTEVKPGTAVVIPQLPVPLSGRRELLWWRFVMQYVSKTVPVVTPDRSAVSGYPTSYVSVSNTFDIELPGMASGVSDYGKI